MQLTDRTHSRGNIISQSNDAFNTIFHICKISWICARVDPMLDKWGAAMHQDSR